MFCRAGLESNLDETHQVRKLRIDRYPPYSNDAREWAEESGNKTTSKVFFLMEIEREIKTMTKNRV